ncbi:MAG: peptidylprolyl isomerase [bacterium]|jgi:peptidylprolyl isomerase|nr:peptidylprolyl isomerase [bacterium]
MVQAKEGDTVLVHYTGTLDDGTVFDSSADREPLEFTLGEGMVIPGFEKAVQGLHVGETSQIRIEPEDAYGEYDDDLLFDIDPTDLPETLEPEIGMVLEVTSQEGSVTNVVISEIEEDHITLDANHPLAGQALTFEINLVNIV